jgi:hypothetical protein
MIPSRTVEIQAFCFFKEQKMKTRLFASTMLLFIWGAALAGGDIPVATRADLEATGVPVYPGAVYCIGNAEAGIRLATNEPRDTVRAWYAEQLPGWTVFEDFGMWMMADSPPGSSFPERVESNNLIVDTNDQIPEWHDLAADMTTQIVIVLPTVP